MASVGSDSEMDLAVALDLNRQTRADPHSPYRGKYLCVLRGEVAAVADTLDDLEEQLERLGIGLDEGNCIEADADYDSTHMIWIL